MKRKITEAEGKGKGGARAGWLRRQPTHPITIPFKLYFSAFCEETTKKRHREQKKRMKREEREGKSNANASGKGRVGYKGNRYYFNFFINNVSYPSGDQFQRLREGGGTCMGIDLLVIVTYL